MSGRKLAIRRRRRRGEVCIVCLTAISPEGCNTCDQCWQELLS